MKTVVRSKTWIEDEIERVEVKVLVPAPDAELGASIRWKLA